VPEPVISGAGSRLRETAFGFSIPFRLFSGSRKLQEPERHKKGAQHKHGWNQQPHGTREQRVSLEVGRQVACRSRAGERQH
jgi:hypothetical protein